MYKFKTDFNIIREIQLISATYIKINTLNLSTLLLTFFLLVSRFFPESEEKLYCTHCHHSVLCNQFSAEINAAFCPPDVSYENNLKYNHFLAL